MQELPSTQQVSCCEKCSCNNDCHETGSCCPDMPISGLIEPKYPCRRLSDFGRNVDRLRYGQSNHWYHVIDDCPNLTKTLAFKNCFEPKEVNDYVIVFDPKKEKLYRNKHCAECNGIFRYGEFKIQANCRDILSLLTNLSSIQETQNFLMDMCSLVSFPPDDFTSVSHCLPETEMISTCNKTGVWNFYDDEIEKACLTKRTGQNVLYRSIIGKGTFYRDFANVYCFLCNVPKGTKEINVCDQDDNDDGKSSRISFHAIIDTKSWREDDEFIKEAMCHPTQIWDSFRVSQFIKSNF